ncbi:hypothetical protein Bbelb_278830 [Branchiostoma belcheri]|nr:hypothetical protein Bbelb_278830 [Branchiostoma belcheri]
MSRPGRPTPNMVQLCLDMNYFFPDYVMGRQLSQEKASFSAPAAGPNMFSMEFYRSQFREVLGNALHMIDDYVAQFNTRVLHRVLECQNAEGQWKTAETIARHTCTSGMNSDIVLRVGYPESKLQGSVAVPRRQEASPSGSPLDPARDLAAARPNCKSWSAPYQTPHGSRRETGRAPDGSLTETGRQGDQKFININ